MRRLAAIACGILLAASPALPHSASRGMHLHVDPESAAPGAEIVIAADAVSPIVSLRIAFVGGKPTEVRPETSNRYVAVRLRVPASARGTVNVHAEAEVGGPKPLRASAVVKVLPAK